VKPELTVVDPAPRPDAGASPPDAGAPRSEAAGRESGEAGPGPDAAARARDAGERAPLADTAASVAPGRAWLHWALPLAVLALAFAGAWALVASRPRPVPQPPVVLPPLVRVVPVEKRTLRLAVRAQGTVEPRTESELVAEAPGRVTWISPAFAAGGFFEEGEPLLRLDAREHEVAHERAAAAVGRAESEVRLAERTIARRRALFAEGIVAAEAIDDAEHVLAVARAALREARAALAQASLDLERTAIAAPFAGRVREVRVDLGQFVGRGSALGRVYAVDYVEIRLPISAEDLAHLELPLDFHGDGAAPGPPVTVTGALGGRTATWRGRVVRTEGELDPRTRTVGAVVRVDDPYGRAARAGGDPEPPSAGAPSVPGRPPLAVGLFVQAEIEGRTHPNVAVLPRSALRDGDRVLVVDGESRLRFRAVEVLRRDRDAVVIGAGLEEGERVCVSPLEAATDGTAVRTVLDDGARG
jgi:RND family efflux transporter MFP subunit